MAAVSPFLQSGSLVSFSVKINGGPIPESLPILSIKIIQVDKILTAEIKFPLAVVDGEPFGILDGVLFNPGNSINVFAGYDNVLSEIFSGSIEKLNVDILSNSETSFTLIATGSLSVPKHKSKPPVLTVRYGESMITFNAQTGGKSEAPGSLTFQGSALAKVGENILLTNVGTRLGGLWAIRSATHDIRDGNWLTTVNISKDS